jgi:GAF domain-containing protein
MERKEPLNELSLMVARMNGLHLTLERAADAVQMLAGAAKSIVPGAAGAGVSLIDDAGRRASAGATDEIVREADNLQYVIGEGPCLEAWQTTRSILSNDLRADQRWPAWRGAVAQLPIVSVVSTPLVAEGRCIGALKVYAGQESVFDEKSVAWLELLAGAAAVLLRSVQHEDTPHLMSKALQEALTRRDAVGRACGVLMERHAISEEQAMRHLVESARKGSTLAEVARTVLSGAGRMEPRDELPWP